MGDHIRESVDRAVASCPIDRMLSVSDARDFQAVAQRRRDEVRALPDGHAEMIQQAWLDMQNAAHTRAMIDAGIADSGSDAASSPSASPSRAVSPSTGTRR